MRSPVLCGVLALALSGCATDPTPVYGITATSTAEAGEAARIISAYRVAQGLNPVSVDGRLNDAAMHQARVIAAAGKLAHGSFGVRMGEFGIAGYAAENLTAGSETVGEAVGRWKASPRHNDNLLMPEARRIGLARADANGGFGRYWALVLGQ